ncbi:MarR family winged helix-turn-helix transcriptional regulator [Demequina lutea]|uniref:DNA-binding MarR family transcriptional regulator n=1 Tax=Demequina lutea TaxID=431489 RepID=A0A7Y9ZG40_9MICO|nr:MarR family winged helix-turn-helix transcriptional regulator [Demequina lutea]NYI42731.1 DNA-binding MarR family transcriptional regulator [Demequina lutea]
MGQTHKVLKETWERQIADLGLSAPLAAMLRTICEQPGSGLRELARRLRTDPMNAKRLVDHLEHEGLVTSSEANSHAQRREVSPTSDGLARVAGLVERSAVLRRQLGELLGESELEYLQELLVRLEDALVDDPASARPRGDHASASDAKPDTTRPRREDRGMKTRNGEHEF